MTGSFKLPDKRQEVPTIREYVDPFMDGYAAAHKPSSRRDKRQRLDAYILPVVGDLRLDELRQEHVDKIIATLLATDSRKTGEKLGRKGINTTMSVLSSLIGYAVKNKLIADPELSYVIKVQDAELEAVDLGDVDKLLAKATDVRYRVAILLATDAGLRIGEIRALPWLEVNELAREITIAWSYDRAGALSETKGWERRSVPVSERLWRALKELERKGPLVFARLNGKPIGYDAVRDVVHEIYSQAEVMPPKQPWHALRHTFITELANRGTPVHVIRLLAGHKSLDTTLRYMHVNREAKRAAIGSLAPAGSSWAAERNPVSK